METLQMHILFPKILRVGYKFASYFQETWLVMPWLGRFERPQTDSIIIWHPGNETQSVYCKQ